MCGRFCCSLNPETIKTTLYQDHITNSKDIEWINQDKFHSGYNICPSRFIVALRYSCELESNVLESMQWGYIPSWSRNISMNKPINARLETLMEKSMYDSSKNTKRCIILAEGFYEWQKVSTKKKPHFIKRKDGQLMIFAALYDKNGFISDKDHHTCAIITTHSEGAFSAIHSRMPVILDVDQIKQWIDPATKWSKPVIDMLRPYKGELEWYQVTDAVGSVHNESKEFVVPLDSKKSSISYFLKQEDPKHKFDQFQHSQKFMENVKPALEIESSSSQKSISSQKKEEKKPVVKEETTSKKRKKVQAEEFSKNNKCQKITNFFTTKK